GKEILFGNSKVEIKIDTISGTVTGLFNKSSKIQYLNNGKPDIFRLNYSNFENQGAVSGDMWSAGYGSVIYGTKQRVSATHFKETSHGAILHVLYDEMNTGNRNIPVAVAYTIELVSNEEETQWNISIKNEDPGTIREVEFPVFAGLAPMDNLIMPNHGGQKLVDPISKLSDENPEVYLEYPARASMQWFEYYSQNRGLYMASYDKNLEYTRMYFGRQDERNNAAMWFVKYPFVVKGQAWQSPLIGVGIHAGDWHWGADHYRTWIESWVAKPTPPKHVMEMIGGGTGLWIKDRDTKTLHTYEEIVGSVDKLKTGPVKNGVMLVGWFYNGHDTYFPEYNAIPDLGGDLALKKAVDKVHEKGFLVNAYMNGRLNNNETQTYKQFGKKWSVLGLAPGLGVGSINFYELQEGWNKAWEHTKKSEGWFSVMCPSAKGWQDHIVGQVEHGLREYHFDGIFLDQPGSYYAELCYNRNHGHRTPATAWGPGYLEIFKRIYQIGKKLNKDFSIWSEGMNDAYSQYLDFHTDKNPIWIPMRAHPQVETFVEMWRYTMPWCITQNGRDKYSLPASKDMVYGDYYRFLLGIRGISPGFDTTWHGSKADSLQRVSVVEKIEKLWRKGGEFFFYGTFKDDVGITVSDTNVLAKSYISKNGIAIPIWNTTKQPLNIELLVDTDLLMEQNKQVQEVKLLEKDNPIRYKTVGKKINITMQLMPNDVEVVIIKGSST
ncbi:MAG: DUF6259 domain-containing protein, partial [Bacteroidota bacterium]